MHGLRFPAAGLAAALLALPAFGAGHGAGDPEDGRKVFRLCMACHSTEPGQNLVGPHLHNLIGREAGSVEGFNYSKAHRESGIVWTRETLNPYLKSPASYIPGNRMMFMGVPDDRQRADLIAYLASEDVSPDASEEEGGAGAGGGGQ